MTDPTPVTVPVPGDRVAEFYRWFAEWLEDTPATPAEPSTPSPEEQLTAAIRWWKLLKPSERGIFGLWINEAPKMVTAEEIIERLELNGPRDIPGILSWSGRKGRKAGFRVHWSFRYDPATEAPIYGIEDAEYADVLRQARSAVEEA